MSLHGDEYFQLSEYEVVIVTPDVHAKFDELVTSGMRAIKSPVQDAFYGTKAFVQDLSGVLIELRAAKRSRGTTAQSN